MNHSNPQSAKPWRTRRPSIWSLPFAALAAEPGNVAGAVVDSARRGLSYDKSPEDHTMHLAENLVALHVFVDLGAALDGGLRPGNHQFVIGVTAAEGSCRLAFR